MPDEKARILPLRYWDDPVLSTVCAKIEDSEFGPELEEFGRQLVATMEDRNGVGLAAPQVGVARRVFAMRFPDHDDREALVVCNPVLVLDGRTLPGREGCLSLPGVWEQVYRAEKVAMRFFDLHGVETEMDVTLWDARVVQHETDHLDGLMFFDWKDKRESYATPAHPQPWGARMSKQLSKGVMREWERSRDNGDY